MTEGAPNQNEYLTKKQRRERREKFVALAKEMFEKGEVMPFPGIGGKYYSRIKADEEEFPGYATPIDELLNKFEKEGMKIVLGNSPESGNIFILPGESDSIDDSLQLKHLNVDTISHKQLLELISIQKSYI